MTIREPLLSLPIGEPRRVPVRSGEPGPTYVETHDSLESMLTPSAASETAHARLRSALFRNRKDQATWFGIDGGAEDVLRLVRNGWPEGVARLRGCLSELSANLPASVKRQRCRADQGDEFDIHRANCGGLDRAWRRTRRARQQPRHVCIVFEDGGHYKIPASQFFWRGAVALTLADMLEHAGYRVEVVVAGHAALATHNGCGHHCAVTVKKADMPLDVDALAASLCLAGFYRVAFFARRAMLPSPVRVNFGRHVAVERGFLDPQHQGAIVVRSGAITNQASAQRWLTQTLADLEGVAAP